PSWATRPATREESADEYTNKYHAGRSPSIAAPSTHGHSGGATGLLGAAARILGEPLDLSRTTRRRRPLPVRLSHQHHSSAARNAGPRGARSEERRVGEECRWRGWWVCGRKRGDSGY